MDPVRTAAVVADPQPNYGVVRAESGRFTPHFVRSGIVAIGWEELGDFRALDREELRAKISATYGGNLQSVAITTGQLWRFVHDVSEGDYVLTPNHAAGTHLVGQVVSPALREEKSADECYPTRRRVKQPHPASFSVPEPPAAGGGRTSAPPRIAHHALARAGGSGHRKGRVHRRMVRRRELGPRALGHRSILCRPDSIPLRVRLSEGMKQREWYRPVAPMLLPEVAHQSLQGYRSGPAPPLGAFMLGAFMLGAWKVTPTWREPLRGCVHADGTVRAQMVDESNRPLAHIHQLMGTMKPHE